MRLFKKESDYPTMRKRLHKTDWPSKLSGGFSDSFQEFINRLQKAV